MGKLFDINSNFFHFMTRVADCMFLSLLWLLACIPLVTIGASTTALYYCAVKVIREEEGGLWKSFWHSFRINFKQSTILSLPILLACGFWFAVLEAMAVAGQSSEPLYIVALMLLAVAIAWLHYIFSYIARFTDTLRVVLRNTFLICISEFPRSLLLLGMFVAVVVAIMLNWPVSPVILVFVPSVYMLIASFLLERIYRKYRKDEEESEGEEVISNE